MEFYFSTENNLKSMPSLVICTCHELPEVHLLFSAPCFLSKAYLLCLKRSNAVGGRRWNAWHRLQQPGQGSDLCPGLPRAGGGSLGAGEQGVGVRSAATLTPTPLRAVMV